MHGVSQTTRRPAQLDQLPQLPLTTVLSHGASSACRRICKLLAATHDAAIEELAPVSWPDDASQVARLLARLPNLTAADFTRLGPDPTGFNPFRDAVALLAEHSKKLRSLKLGAHVLPITKLAYVTDTSTEEETAVLQEREAPTALTALKNLECLHIEHNIDDENDESDITYVMICRGSIRLPFLKHLYLKNVVVDKDDYVGPLGAFAPCLPRLETLSLGGKRCWHKQLAQQLAKCTNLQSLQLLNVVDAAVEEYEDSEEQALDDTSGILQALHTLKHLTKLKFSTVEVDPQGTTLPDRLVALTQLRHLDLGGCDWPLPAAYTQLAQLTQLVMPRSSRLRQGIGRLTALQVLTAGPSAIGSPTQPLPDSLGQLTALRELCLAEYRASGGLPASLAGCSLLTKLELCRRGNMHWSPVLNQLTGLVELRADGCSRPSRGRIAFEGLERLQVLRLGSTGCSDLDGSMARLTQLRGLDVSGNMLFDLPEGLVLPLLEWLDMSRNYLCEVPELQQFSSLRRLALQAQRLSPYGSALAEKTGSGQQHRLLYSQARDLPAWLLQLPALLEVQIDEHPRLQSAVLGRLHQVVAERRQRAAEVV